jgi:TatA/E family protein of Tat protein translocase
MVTDILQPTHLLFVLVVALLVLGPKRLPEVARTLGNGLRDFREAISGESHRDGDDAPGHQILPDDGEFGSAERVAEAGTAEAGVAQPVTAEPTTPPAEPHTTTAPTSDPVEPTEATQVQPSTPPQS